MNLSDGSLLVGRAAEVREIDRRTIADLGIPSRVLMELAGAATAHAILARRGSVSKAVVLCGPGNNGGDGFVVARHLQDAGWDEVVCVLVGEASHLPTDAAANRELWVTLGGVVLAAEDVAATGALQSAEVVVDALFGTGMSRPLHGAAASLVATANATSAFKVAVDIPTGLGCDTGQLQKVTFRADLTTTYGVSKFGLHQWPGAGAAGEVLVAAIGWPRSMCLSVGLSARLVTEPAAAALLPQRPSDGHKGVFGHVGVIGGASGMEGAAILAGLGAMRVGAGLTTWNRVLPAGKSLRLVGDDARPAMTVMRPPELMVHDVVSAAGTITGIDARSKVLVVGPGMGRSVEGEALLKLALAAGRPLVLDADAINIIADGTVTQVLPAETILTPHPAEAGRLLGIPTAQVQADRLAAVEALVARLEAVVVLKGAASLVGAPGRPVAILEGAEPTLAVAGSGDVLAGVIGGLLAQGMVAADAAVLGCFLHSRAGVLASLEGDHRGALASDIADAVRSACGHLAAASPWWNKVQ